MQFSLEELKIIEKGLIELEKIKKRRDSRNSIENLMSTSELLSLMKITNQTVCSWRKDGLISYFNIGNQYYYRIEDIINVLNDSYIPRKKIVLRKN